MKNFLRPQLLLIAALLVSLASCTSRDNSGPAGTTSPGTNSPDSTSASTAAPGTTSKTPPKNDLADQRTRSDVVPSANDTLIRAYSDDPDTLNIITSSDNVSSTFQRWVYEPMAAQKYRDPDEWEPALAESWEFDPDTLEYTIKLRKGVKWHPIKLPNGKELKDVEFTSRDVKFTFDCILNENIEAASLRSYFTDPEAETDAEKFKIKVTPVDKYTVKIKWTKPYFMANEFTLGIPIMPRHVYSVDKNGEPISFDFTSKEFADGFNNHWANTTMCGTGPLIFGDWVKDQKVTLTRNHNYWGQPFYFETVIFKNISNPNTMLQQLLQNELDFAGISEKDQYIQTKEHPSVTSGKVNLVEFRMTGYRYVGWNLKRELFKDPKVRMALSHAVPVDTIIDKIYFGLADRTTGPFLPGSTAYDDTLKPIPEDLDKARQLLDEAGWKDTDEDGVRDKMINGKKVDAKFDLMIYSDSPQYLSIAEIIKESFRKIGVDARIEPAKWALMLQKLRKKEFDATILGWVSDWRSDPFQIWHGSQAELQESSNSIGYQNAEVDAAIDELRVTIDPEKQAELYKKIHRLIYEDQPYTFLYLDKATGGLHQRIENVEFFPKLRPHYDVREWSASSPR